ncbi:MAG: acyl-CoA thioesterase [Proteobacteria bacterium]|nr:acyl-CoA thioesterase [Pseudomonadota bacterium]
MNGEARTPPPSRADFAHFLAIPTRWMDNDTYGHVNNVVYYAYFDTVVNEHLIRAGGLDIHDGAAMGVVVETRCHFRASLAFPEVVDAGLVVRALGRSSVTYAIGLFRAGADDAAAFGRFVHVWVDRTTRQPVAIPAPVRAALEPLVRGEAA